MSRDDAPSPFRVLLVDDNEDHRFLTRRAIRSFRDRATEVVMAENGEQGLRLAAESPLDLALVDIKMPGMDGFEVLRRLRQDARTRGLAVVMFTSSENAQDLARARALGADDYITKPLDPSEFQSTMHALLRVWSREVARRREAPPG